MPIIPLFCLSFALFSQKDYPDKFFSQIAPALSQVISSSSVPHPESRAFLLTFNIAYAPHSIYPYPQSDKTPALKLILSTKRKKTIKKLGVGILFKGLYRKKNTPLINFGLSFPFGEINFGALYPITYLPEDLYYSYHLKNFFCLNANTGFKKRLKKFFVKINSGIFISYSQGFYSNYIDRIKDSYQGFTYTPYLSVGFGYRKFSLESFFFIKRPGFALGLNFQLN